MFSKLRFCDQVRLLAAAYGVLCILLAVTVQAQAPQSQLRIKEFTPISLGPCVSLLETAVWSPFENRLLFSDGRSVFMSDTAGNTHSVWRVIDSSELVRRIEWVTKTTILVLTTTRVDQTRGVISVYSNDCEKRKSTLIDRVSKGPAEGNSLNSRLDLYLNRTVNRSPILVRMTGLSADRRKFDVDQIESSKLLERGLESNDLFLSVEGKSVVLRNHDGSSRRVLAENLGVHQFAYTSINRSGTHAAIGDLVVRIKDSAVYFLDTLSILNTFASHDISCGVSRAFLHPYKEIVLVAVRCESLNAQHIREPQFSQHLVSFDLTTMTASDIRLIGVSGGLLSAQFSSDGNWLATEAGGELYMVSGSTL